MTETEGPSMDSAITYTFGHGVIGGVLCKAKDAVGFTLEHRCEIVAGGGTTLSVIGVATHVFRDRNVATAFAIIGLILAFVAVELHRLGGLNFQVKELAKTKDALNADIEKLQGHITTLGATANTLGQQVGELGTIVQNLEQQRASSRELLETLQEIRNNLHEEVTNLTMEREKFDTEIAHLQTHIGSLNTTKLGLIKQTELLSALVEEVKVNVESMTRHGAIISRDTQDWLAATQVKVQLAVELTKTTLQEMNMAHESRFNQFINAFEQGLASVLAQQVTHLIQYREETDALTNKFHRTQTDLAFTEAQLSNTQKNFETTRVGYDLLLLQLRQTQEQNNHLVSQKQNLLNQLQTTIRSIEDAIRLQNQVNSTTVQSTDELLKIIQQVGIQLQNPQNAPVFLASPIAT